MTEQVAGASSPAIQEPVPVTSTPAALRGDDEKPDLPAEAPSSAKSTSFVEQEKQLLDKLREFVEAKGLTLGEGWRVEFKVRSTGTSAGSRDAYYFSPQGKRFRSRQEIARVLGLPAEPSRPKAGGAAQPSRESAAVAAKARLQATVLPLALPNRVTVLRLGQVRNAPGYVSSTQLYPGGFAALCDFGAAGRLVSGIEAGPKGSTAPLFTVTWHPAVVPPLSALAAVEGRAVPDSSAMAELGQGERVTAADSPDAVWHAVASIQQHLRQGQAPQANVQQAACGMAASPTPAVPAAQLDTAMPEQPAEEPPSSSAAHGRAGDQAPPAAADRAQLSGGQTGSATFPATARPEGSLEATSEPAAAAAGVTDLAAAVQQLSAAAQQGLQRLPQLTGVVGSERYGFHEPQLLQALEGLEGVEECSTYRFVEEYTNWAAYTKLLAKLAEQKAQGAGAPAAKRKRAAGTGEGSAKRGRPAPGSMSMEADGSAVAKRSSKASGMATSGGKAAAKDSAQINKVLDKLIRAVEVAHDKEARSRERQSAAAAKKAAAAERAARKEEARARDAAARPDTTQLQAGATGAARAPPLTGSALPMRPRDDWELPNAALPPPPPTPVGCGALPVQLLPPVVEVWSLLHRFSALPGLGEVPALHALEASLADPHAHTASGGVATRVAQSLVALLVDEAFNTALEVAEVLHPDMRKRDVERAAPAVQAETWLEAARRYLMLAAAATAARRLDCSGGSGAAISGVLTNTPLGNIDARALLQALTEGLDTLYQSTALLPQGGAPAADSAKLRDHSARALAEALKLCGCAGEHHPLRQRCRHMIAVLCKVKGGRIKGSSGKRGNAAMMVSRSEEAAAVVRAGRHLDLRAVAARVDAGVYDALPQGVGLAAFGADVRAVTQLWRAAMRKSTSVFGGQLGEGGGAPLPDAVEKKLAALMAEENQGAVTNEGVVEDSEDSDAEEGTAEAAAAGGGPPGGGASRTLHRCAPYDGCVVCWADEDRARLLLCDGCDGEFHTYCLEPPLEEVPEGEWYCPHCATSQQRAHTAPGCSARQADDPLLRREGAASDMSRAAAALSGREWQELSPAQRTHLLRLLCCLLEDSVEVRSALAETQQRAAEIRREIASIRGMKRRKGKGEEGGEASSLPAAAVKTRSAEPTPEEAAARLPQLMAELDHCTLRAQLLGHDRSWRRYWLLARSPASPGWLLVEHPGADGGGGGAQPAGEQAMGWYITFSSIAALLAWLNAAGPREGPLRAAVLRYRDALAATFSDDEALAAAAAGVVRGAGPPPGAERGAGGGDSEAARAAGSGKGEEGDGGGKAAAARDVERHNAAAAAPPELGAADAAMAPDAAAQVAAAAASGDLPPATRQLHALQQELLDLQERLLPECYDSSRATPELWTRWRASVLAATSAAPLLAGLLVLEECLRSGCLKPNWRLWALAQPCPGPDTTAGAVRLRLAALQAALKRPSNGDAGGGEGPAARAALHERSSKAAARARLRQYADDEAAGSRQRAQPSEMDEDGSDAERERQEARDAALARQLQQQLGGGYERATRSVRRLVVRGPAAAPAVAGRGERVTRSMADGRGSTTNLRRYGGMRGAAADIDAQSASEGEEEEEVEQEEEAEEEEEIGEVAADSGSGDAGSNASDRVSDSDSDGGSRGQQQEAVISRELVNEGPKTAVVEGRRKLRKAV